MYWLASTTKDSTNDFDVDLGGRIFSSQIFLKTDSGEVAIGGTGLGRNVIEIGKELRAQLAGGSALLLTNPVIGRDLLIEGATVCPSDVLVKGDLTVRGKCFRGWKSHRAGTPGGKWSPCGP